MSASVEMARNVEITSHDGPVWRERVARGAVVTVEHKQTGPSPQRQLAEAIVRDEAREKRRSSLDGVKSAVVGANLPDEFSYSQFSDSAGRPHGNGNNSNNAARSLTLPRASKAKSARPPILSPKPFVAPKPKPFLSSPDQRSQSRDNVFKFNSGVVRRVSAPSLPQNQTAKKPVPYPGVINRPSLERSSSEGNYQFDRVASRQDSASTKPASPRLSPRVSNMDAVVSPIQVTSLDGRKMPPKVATKPKVRPAPLDLNTNPQMTNGTAEPKPGETDALAKAPVSEKRQRFESMKIKFKKPVPDPVYNNSTTGGRNGPLSPRANELFKDILAMKDLESFGMEQDHAHQTTNEEPEYRSREAELIASAPTAEELEYLNEQPWSLEHEKPRERVEPSQNLSHLKEKYEHEFKTKLINSLISPTEKKKFFKSDPDPTPGFPKPNNSTPDHKLSPPVGKITHEAMAAVEAAFGMPAYPRPSAGHRDQNVDFSDLPPPPDLPPPESPKGETLNLPPPEIQSPRGNQQQQASIVNDVALRPQTTACENRSPGAFPNAHAMIWQKQQQAPSDSREERRDETAQPSVTPSLNSSAERPNVTSSVSVSNNRQSQSSVIAVKGSGAQNLPGGENDRPSPFPLTVSEQHQQQRGIEEEILYYDNMDIMEKVRQKREQEEKRRQEQILLEASRADTKARRGSDNTSNQRPRHVQTTVEAKTAADKTERKPVPEQKQPTGNASASTEFRSAIGELEYEYLKLKENLEQGNKIEQPFGPPKLPPKQLKFNRQSATQVAEFQVSPVVTPTEQEKSFPKAKKSPSLRLNVSQATSASNSRVPHLPSPMPQPSQPPQNNTQPSVTTSSAMMQQHLFAQQQLSPEEARARSLVDEPLAPILEEDSTYGDSSSCASSVTEDDVSMYADEYSIASLKDASSIRSSRRRLDEDDEVLFDGDTTETETAVSEYSMRESGSTTVHSTSSDSDASSVRWQINPVTSGDKNKSTPPQEPKPFPQLSREQSIGERPLDGRSVSSSLPQSSSKNSATDRNGVYEFVSDEDSDSVLSSRNSLMRATSRESRGSESSISGGRSDEKPRPTAREDKARMQQHHQEQEEKIIHDVAPYGMVDLSKMEPTFEELHSPPPTPYKEHSGMFHRSTSSGSCKDMEPTPTSIMSSVHEFNEKVGTLKKTRRNSEQDDGNLSDTPHFPLDFNVKQKTPIPAARRAPPESRAPPTPVHVRSHSGGGRSNKEEVDEIGYDNLENYGGETRRAAEANRGGEGKRDVTTTSSLKYAKAVKKKSEIKPIPKNRSNDSLSSELGLSRQTPGSRASLPLPTATESHLARHSSAVSALDRHKGNLQRSKGSSSKLDSSQVRSPSARRLDKLGNEKGQQQQQPSTLPRTRSTATNETCESLEKSSSRSVDDFEVAEKQRAESEQRKGRVKELSPTRRAPDIRRNLTESSGSLALRRNDLKPTSPIRSREEDRKQILTSSSSPTLRGLAGDAGYNQQGKEYNPFPVNALDYDESLDDGVVNPYEEVPFRLDAEHKVIQPPQESEEQKEAKNRVQEILDNIQPPESPYKPKPPVPRYPVDYDNFYLGNTGESKSRASSGIGTDEAGRSKIGSVSGATSSSSPPPSPTAEERARTSGFSDGVPTPTSTPASVRSHKRSSSKGSNEEKQTPVAENRTLPRRKSRDDPGEDSSDTASTSTRSIGFQLRSLLGGNQEGKYISPSLRRKRSLLKRSKSPGGSSRRSRTPPRSKSEEEQQEARTPVKDKEEKTPDKRSSKADRYSLKSEVESEPPTPRPKERSASQRLVERRGRGSKARSSFRKSKGSEPEDDSTDQAVEKEKSKLRMSSRWRRSKSQDRSPTRSKSKERKFGSSSRRAKSQERPIPKGLEAREIDIGEEDAGEERSGRSFFRRSRSSSRKRDRRSKSRDRKDEGGGRGRNPVSFFKKLLRSKKDQEEEEEENDIIHVPLGKGVDLSDSTEALTTILAYKGDEVSEKEHWNPPRPNPPQQRPTRASPKAGSTTSTPGKVNRVMRSPPSHRAKKISVNRSHGDHSTESSSEGVLTDQKTPSGKRVSEPYGNLGSNRAFLAPQKPARPSSRKSSFSNSLPSSDSERQSKPDVSTDKRTPNRQQFLKSAPLLRRNLLANREYDSDTATSVLASDADSSTGVQSDVDAGASGLRSAMKRSPFAKLKGSIRDSVTPRRPVRVVSPRRSKSDPSIFVETGNDGKNTYYNIDEDGKPKSLQPEKKRPSKLAPHRRKNPKQTRRQTAPVDIAYASHQRKKYKTLVSLNAQTLRKVTERWLSEWRNKLPVGGFLITSWSDVALESHRPLCMIGNSVVYSSISTGNNQFKLACQLYDQLDVDDPMVRRLERCASLPAHPNTCGVCSHFPCRVPRSLLDPNSRGGAADALCVVLSSRPYQSLQEHLDRVVAKEEPTEYHRQVLITVLQLLQGMRHVLASGYDLPNVSSEHLVITEERGFLQVLPHVDWSDSDSPPDRRDVNKVLDAYQSSDSDSNPSTRRMSHCQQVAKLIKKLLHNGSLVSSTGGQGRPGDRNSAASTVSRVVVPGTKFSSAIKHLIHFLDSSPPPGIQEAIDVVQCALWGPEDLEDVGVDDVSPYSALELWIEMEQAKLVNSLAVLTPGERILPISFLKHQYFAAVHPEVLFKGLKVLQRI